jgi:alpha-L-arabinofuranosidase
MRKYKQPKGNKPSNSNNSTMKSSTYLAYCFVAVIYIQVLLPVVVSGQQPDKNSFAGSKATKDETISHIKFILDASRYGDSISPYIYGEFIEHQGRCIYGGIWAEMIRDRKFYYPIDTLVYGDPNHKSSWRVIPLGTYVEMDTLNAFVGKHSPRIDLTSGFIHGISLDSITLQASRNYTGHIVLSGTGTVVVKVSLVWGPDPSDRQTVEINSLSAQYKPTPLSFTSGANTGLGQIEIVGEGNGSFYVGTISLMPSDNIQGMRADVIRLLQELGGTIYRWPGGWFGNGYNWKEAIGERDKRAPMLNEAYGTKQIEPNDFGPDEFMSFVHTIHADPYIGVSAILPSDAQMAADEVEYFNGSSPTPMGQLRAANGHPDPYNVKYWGIGCETWGFEALNDYVSLHNQIAQAMLAKDPEIKIVGVGGLGSQGAVPGQGEWSEEMLSNCGDHMDYMSEHIYASLDGSVPQYSRNLAVMVDTFVAAHHKFARNLSVLQNKKIPVVFDEWNYTFLDKPYLYGDGGVRNYFKDALGIASALQELIRNSKDIFIANTHPVNVLGHIKTTDTAAAFEVTALPLIMYRHHFGTLPYAVTDACDSRNILAALTSDHQFLTLGIVNPGAEDFYVNLQLRNAEQTAPGEWWQIASSDTMAYNEPGKPPVVAIDSGMQSGITTEFIVPPWSISLFKLPIKLNREVPDSAILKFIKTVQITPDTLFKTAAFLHTGYIPDKGNLAVTFGGQFKKTINSLDDGYAYKEYDLDMNPLARYGSLCAAKSDIGGLMVGNEFYAVAMNPEGWSIALFNAVTWEKEDEFVFPLDPQTRGYGDMMLASVNGLIDIADQIAVDGLPCSSDTGASTFHEFFTPDLVFQEERILDDTPHITGCIMIYIDGIYYFVSASAYSGDIIIMKYDASWNFLGKVKLIDEGLFSEGLVFDGHRFYVSYMDTRCRVQSGFPYYTNARVAAFDTNWNILEDIAVTDFIPADSLAAARPSLLLHNNKLYVSYDVIPLPEDLNNIEGYVSMYEISAVNPVSIKHAAEMDEESQLEQNYPNPFSSTTQITFSLPDRQQAALKVYDIRGSEVAELVNEVKQPGTYTVTLNAKDLPGGVYFYSLISGCSVYTKKLLLVK